MILITLQNKGDTYIKVVHRTFWSSRIYDNETFSILHDLCISISHWLESMEV